MPPAKDARTKLLDAAIDVVRSKGFAATSVDELCRAAGVTKGALFHHFRTKEELGAAAAGRWGERAVEIFASAPYHALEDPRDRVLGYVAFRKALLGPDLATRTCYVGTTVQETFESYPAIRDACGEIILSHALTLEADLAAAIAAHSAPDGVDARSLALHIQAVIQGAFILAKALNDPAPAADSLDHLSRYLELLFPKRKET
jgi:TetR/AcrR family transcriptional regulator, transcriptional repressor for nem operon